MHVNYVEKVFRRFKKLDLYVNLKKLEYLDFTMSVDDIKINSRRINTIRK